MVRVTVYYPNQPGARFDLDYYLSHHMPMVAEKLRAHGMKSWSVSKGVGGFGGAAATFLIQASLDFDSMEGLQAGMASESAAIMADIPNYTELPPQIQIDEVLH
jgi:uncharacterized protein (TIGR02118 family)